MFLDWELITEDQSFNCFSSIHGHEHFITYYFFTFFPQRFLVYCIYFHDWNLFTGEHEWFHARKRTFGVLSSVELQLFYQKNIYCLYFFSILYSLMSTSRKFMRQIKSFWSLHFQLPHFLYQNYAVIELVLCWKSKISKSVQRVRNNIVSSFHVSYKLFPLDIQKDSKQ